MAARQPVRPLDDGRFIDPATGRLSHQALRWLESLNFDLATASDAATDGVAPSFAYGAILDMFATAGMSGMRYVEAAADTADTDYSMPAGDVDLLDVWTA